MVSAALWTCLFLLHFEQVRGVGTIETDFLPNKRVYTLIGENGVGKTKFLECLFTLLFLVNEEIQKHGGLIKVENVPFKKVIINSEDYLNIEDIKDKLFNDHIHLSNISNSFKQNLNSSLVYIPAQNRSNLRKKSDNIGRLGDRKERTERYFKDMFNVLSEENQDLRDLNSDINIQEWIIQRAQSSNPYQSKEDNREIEITTLLKLLNQIDERIDANFLEISGDNRVFIKIENQKRELSELSSGFTSIFKIIQTIIAGYSYFTNEVQIANVRGIVLIDEIESHLHNEWQVKIIPLLKQLFPNTTFFITTHSSLVISQLEDGEAYRLQRETDGVVYGKAIAHPSNASFIDLLNEAFNVDLNTLNIERTQGQSESQKAAKQALLKLVQQELAKGAEK